MDARDDRPGPIDVSRAEERTGAPRGFIGKQHLYNENRRAKSAENAAKAEHKSKRALLLGGGAPNMALMAGTVLAFHKRGVEFDVISTSGAGAVVALLWLAPKGLASDDALRNIVNLSVSDPIYQGFSVNYKVFNKPGGLADLYRQWLAMMPGASMIFDQSTQNAMQRLASDWMQLAFATFCPSDLNPLSPGLCAPLPFIDGVIEFSKVKSIAPYFYVNAYNIDRLRMDDFTKDVITADHIRAALGFPLIYGPFKLGEHHYYEGAVVDCVNYKDVVEKHPGLETLVVLDVLGAPSLIRQPRNLYDSWVLSMIIPLVSNAQDDTELFALKHNHGWLRREGAKRDLFKVAYDIPEAHLVEALDWSSSNARRLFEIGYKAGLAFCDDHPAELGLTTRAAAAASTEPSRKSPTRKTRGSRQPDETVSEPHNR